MLQDSIEILAAMRAYVHNPMTADLSAARLSERADFALPAMGTSVT